MPNADITETFSALVTRIRDTYPRLAFLVVIMPRIYGAADDPEADTVHAHDSDDFLRAIWKSGPHADERTYIAVGGFGRESAIGRAQHGDLVAFGRAFLANVSGSGSETVFFAGADPFIAGSAAKAGK